MRSGKELHATDCCKLFQQRITTVCGKRVKLIDAVEDLWGAVSCIGCKAILVDRTKAMRQGNDGQNEHSVE